MVDKLNKLNKLNKLKNLYNLFSLNREFKYSFSNVKIYKKYYSLYIMAELALPLIGLGALYVISNKEKDKKCPTNENFINMGAKNNLPNTNIPNKNYPVSNQPIDKTSNNYTREYLNPNQTTDKFYNSDVGLKNINTSQLNNNFESLSGNSLEMSNFKHNNMVPFFGAVIKGSQIYKDNAQTIFDNYQGMGSQDIKKTEQAPLFKPEDNTQWSYGAPNQSDFLQSRQLPSTKMANAVPWEQQKVAPGLGLGYTTEGAGGFNAGMLDRSSWQPPTVDKLRVANNPKLTYGLDGHQGPAQSTVQNTPVHGKVEKHSPDTDYAMGAERWFTTTGSSLGPTQIPEQMLGDVNKCTTQYYGSVGNAGDSKSTYIRGHHEQSNKAELCGPQFSAAAAPGQGMANANDYGIQGYNILKNNRNYDCESKNNGAVGAINSAFKAMVAPIVDVLRPSRKENVIYNANQLGNIQSAVPSLPLTNPKDQLKTTNKEMTGEKIGLNYLNISHVSANKGGAHEVTGVQVKEQQRNMCDSSSMGNVGNTLSGPINETAWYNQHNNVNKTSINWPMPGGTQIYQPNANVQIAKRDNDRVNNRLQCEDFIQSGPIPLSTNIPSVDTFGKINMPQQYDIEVNSNRINPDILSAFKSNPYAQSLNSY